jgi:hypothetical protein
MQCEHMCPLSVGPSWNVSISAWLTILWWFHQVLGRGSDVGLEQQGECRHRAAHEHTRVGRSLSLPYFLGERY